MSNKQFKTYCRIIDYLNATDPDLAELIRGTCTEMSLTSLKGKPGITFLAPDAAYRAEIEKLAYSANADDAMKAADMLNALIIKDDLQSTDAWNRHKDDLPNSIHPSQHVQIESASGSEVKFANGSKATLDAAFKKACSSKRGNLSIWKLTGRIPTNGPQAKLTHLNKNRGKVGSYDAAEEGMFQRIRFQVMLAIENTYAVQRMQRGAGASGGPDAYLCHELSLIGWAMDKHSDIFFDRILPLVSLDKCDLYFLLEPHKPAAPYILEDDFIREWWNYHLAGFSAKTDKQIYAALEVAFKNHRGEAKIYSDRRGVLDAVASIRAQVLSKIPAQPRNCIAPIQEAYNALSKQNTINGFGPIFPSGLHGIYAAEDGLKMLQDELRFLCYSSFCKLEAQPFDPAAFNELTNMIAECQFVQSAPQRERKYKLLNKNTLKCLVSPNQHVEEVQVFVNSSLFLYIPVPCDEAKGIFSKYSLQHPQPGKLVAFNPSEAVYTRHERILNSQASAGASSRIVEALKSLNVDTLDPELRKVLREKFNS